MVPGGRDRSAPSPGWMRLAVLERTDLPLDLGLEPALHVAEGVDVLELGLGAEGLARPPHRDVGVAAQGALLHVDVAHVQVLQQALELGQEARGLLGRADVGLADDLHQRRAAAVEVDQRVLGSLDAPRRAAGVDELARVLLHVRPGDADPVDAAVVQLDVQMAADADGQVVLRDLVALGQVGIEVVLAVEDGVVGDAAVQRQRDARGVLDRPLVGDRQRCPGAPGRPGRRACWARRRSSGCSRRTSWWRS